jgi:hypothetical protein
MDISFVETRGTLVGSLFTIETGIHAVRANKRCRLVKTLVALFHAPVLVLFSFASA